MNDDYSIGQAAQLTGLTTHNIRKWEERHAAIEPRRSPGGDRRYSSQAVARLTMLKELVDSGRNLSELAPMTDHQLRALCAENLKTENPPSQQRYRVGVVGESLPTILTQHRAFMPRLDIIDIATAGDKEIDALLIEQPGMDESVFERLQTLRDAHGVDAVVVLYGYAPQSLTTRVSDSITACARMPVNYVELERTVTALLATGTERLKQLDPTPSRYSKQVLARVAAMSPTIACECPRHVAEIIFALTDFETYSANCEDRNPMDAAIHNYLKVTAAQARVAFEQAMATVAAHEEIPLDEWQSETPG